MPLFTFTVGAAMLAANYAALNAGSLSPVRA
jgi:hypothetical protein